MDISRACACACSSFLPDALDLSPVCWPPLLPPSAEEEEEVGTDCNPARAIAAAALVASFFSWLRAAGGRMPVLDVLLLVFILEEKYSLAWGSCCRMDVDEFACVVGESDESDKNLGDVEFDAFILIVKREACIRYPASPGLRLF